MTQRFRKIYPLIWDDEDFQEISLEEKMVCFYCLTCRTVNRIGLFYFSEGEATEKLGLSSCRFRNLFAKICEKFDWKFDEKLRVLYIPTWWKWNAPENPSVLKGNLIDVCALPRTSLLAEFANNLRYLPATLHDTFRTRLADVCYQEQEQEQEQEQQQQQEQDVAAAAAGAAHEDEDLVESLVERGLSPSLAKDATRAGDPSLIREVIAFYDAEKGGYENPAGALRSMLKEPRNWGFGRTAVGWIRPPPGTRRKAAVAHSETPVIKRIQTEQALARAETARHLGLTGAEFEEFVRTGKGVRAKQG